MDSGLLQLDAQLGDLARAMVWSLALLAGGFAVWRVCESRHVSRVPWGLCFAMGCASAMLLVTIGTSLGLGGRMSSLFAFASVFAAVSVIRWRWRTRWLPSVPSAWTTDRLVGAGLAGVALLGLVLMMPMLSRPHVSYDILSYHLPLAHSFREFAWGYIDGNVYSRMPGGAFVLYGAVLSDAASTLDDPGVRVLLWAAIAAGALLCAEIAGQLGGRWSARGFAAALFVWHPMVWGGLGNAHNDLLVALFALGAVSSLLRGRSRGRLWILMAGLLGGSAVAVKFSALGIVAVPLAFATAVLMRGDWKARMMSLLWLALGGAIAYGPWMLRAWMFGGHPLHPFMGAAEGWSLEQGRFITGHHQPITPFVAQYWVDAFARLAYFRYNVGPLVSIVALGLAVGLLAWWRRRSVAVVAIMAWLGYAALLMVRISPDRFAMPSVALGCVVLAVVATIAWRRPIRRYGIFAAACVLALLSAPWAFAALLLGPEAFDRNSTMPEQILVSAHEEIGDGQALLLFEARGRWFLGSSGRMPMMNTTWDVPPWAEGLKESNGPEEFAGWLHQRGVRVVVVNEFELGRLVDFYGGHGLGRMMGNIGVEGNRPRMLDALAHYKPFEFARFGPEERERLLQFLEWSRLRAKTVVPAGQVARIWITPLKDLPAAQGDSDGDS